MNTLLRRLTVSLFVALALFLLSSAPALADVIIAYQTPTFDGALYASQNDPNQGNFATLYDNFKSFAQIPYILTDVHWYGGYFNPIEKGTITGWTISLYADAGNAVGNLLWTQYFGDTAFESYIGVYNGMTYYGYHEDDIPNGYIIQPNTMYWLSLVPDVAFPPQWGWGTGSGGDGISYQDWYGIRTPIPGIDFAFDISAVPTPEPGSMILLGTGLAGIASALRRRFF